MAEEIKTEKADTKPEKKKSKKDVEIEELKKELDSKNDLLIRTAAEFDNFKKRTEKERLGISQYAKSEIAKKLLPILDNIDRAQSSDPGSAEYIKGIEMIVKQFKALPEQISLEEIGVAGEAFDPNFHEAVMHIEDENLGENVIAEVLQKGYKLGDIVLRAAMVKVAN